MTVGLTFHTSWYMDRFAGLDICGPQDALSIRIQPVADLGAHFRRVVAAGEPELTEMSLGFFLHMVATGDRRYAGLPVFPSRSFRHNQVYVRQGAGIASAKDLRGRRVGVAEYHMTAATWIRGMLAHDHGVDPRNIEWWSPDTHEAVALGFPLPPGVDIRRVPEGQSLDGMIAAGELDAIVASTAPPSYRAAGSRLARLFPDHRAVEEEYYRRTRLFPIMHLVVVRRDFCDRHPGAVGELLRRFDAARLLGAARLTELGTLAVMHPWLGAELERVRDLFEPDPFRYGVAANRHVVETAIDYAFEQGLIAAKPRLEDLFAPESMDWSGAAGFAGRW